MRLGSYFILALLEYLRSSTWKNLPFCYIFRITKFLFFGELGSCRLYVLIQFLLQINTLFRNYNYLMVHAVGKIYFFCMTNEQNINTLYNKTQWSLAVPGFPFFVVIHFNNIFSTFRDLFRRFGMRLGILEVRSSRAPSIAQTTPSSTKIWVSLWEIYCSWFLKFDSS